jgi:putative ABC transport system permease protein
MSSIYGLAWRYLFANRVRSLLSVAAVMLGVAVTISGSMIAGSVREGILRSDELRVLMEGMIAMLDPAMLFIGLVVMLAAGFLIFNTFGMTITRRRQQIGGLRALGLTRGQTMRVILAEALLLGVVGAALGVIFSLVLGQLLIAFIKPFAGQMVAFGDAAPAPPVVIFAAVMGLLITLLSVLLPARRAARAAPLDALREPEAAGLEPARRGQTALGAILMAGLLAYVILMPPGEWVAYPLDAPLTALVILLWLAGVMLLLPGVIGLAARLGRRLLPGTTGRLMTDNLRRARGRVTLTVLTLAFALLVIIALNGFMDFFLNHSVGATLKAAGQRDAFFVSRIDIAGGWGEIIARGLDSIMLADDELQALVKTVEGSANYTLNYFVVVPELSFFGSGYFSYMINPVLLRGVGDVMFTFSEGDWNTALPVMEAGCGALVSPAVAARNNVGLGDTLTITGRGGPLDCTIAGLGTSVAGATIISDTQRDQLTDMNPSLVLILPHLDTDPAELAARIQALSANFPEIRLTWVSDFAVALDDSGEIINVAFNAMLVLASFAAAFGVVNTMLMSVDERRREIGLLRAVGATRAQMRRIIIGEAVFMGAVGGVVGLAAGLGAVLIIVLTYGLNSIGLDADLLPIALASAQAALATGFAGLIAAPVMAALAAWLPARGILRETPIETLALT